VSQPLQTRSYDFHGLNIKVSCPASVAEALDGRFRLLASAGAKGETISFDFESVTDASQHRLQKPQGRGLAFYQLALGEALYFRAADQLYLGFGDGVRVICEPGLGCASFSVVEREPVNLFMASHLLFTILLVEIIKRRGWYSVHAAAFSMGGKAILLPGTSGSGKSTLALTLLRNGFGYLSDDMVFLRQRADGPAVLGLPEDVDVSDQTIHFFPELDFLRRASKTRGWTKKQVRADEVYGVEPVEEAKPGAIVFPQIAHRETSALRRIDSDEALRELVSNVLLTEGRSCQRHLDILTELVTQTPCYRLETGHDFDCIPVLLAELLGGSREQVHV
jgi:hypothetical protein